MARHLLFLFLFLFFCIAISIPDVCRFIFHFLLYFYLIYTVEVDGSAVFNCFSVQKILKVGLPSAFYIFSIRYDVIVYKICKDLFEV